MSALCNSGLFGGPNQYIKFQGGDAIAVSGANTFERLILSDVRIPYKQVMKSRVILRPGQTNYLLNHLGVGDNVTFLAIKATYDKESTRERDNFIRWNFFDDFSNLYPMKEMMVLTGNSQNRIKQIYLTNPNDRYAVNIDVMVAVIDDTANFFQDTVNQVGLSFTNLTLGSFETYVVDQSIVIYDNSTPRSAIAYISLSSITNIQRTGKILVMNSSNLGTVFLDFETEFDARQTQSLINFVLNNAGISIQNLPQVEDTTPPVVTFYSNLGGLTSSDPIVSSGTSSSPIDTSMWSTGDIFSVVFDTAVYGTPYQKDDLVNLMVDNITDNRDGNMTVTSGMFTLRNPSNVPVQFISDPPIIGTWSLSMNITDIAGNIVPAVPIEIYVI